MIEKLMNGLCLGCIGENSTVKNLGIVNSCIIAYDNVGGLVATNYSGIVENCYNAATVDGVSTVGGITAYGMGIVKNCYNTGIISGTDGTVGGVAGSIAGLNNGGSLTGCYYLEDNQTGDSEGAMISKEQFAVKDTFLNSGWSALLKVFLQSKIYNKTRYYCDMHPLCCLKGGYISSV